MTEEVFNQVEVFVSEPVQKVLKTRTFGDSSNRINEICERYLELVRFDMPTLSLNEWVALLDCLNGTLRDASTIQCLEHDISDAIALDQLDKCWNIDGDDFCNRLKAMTYGQKTAIVEVVDRYWSAYGGKSVDANEALESIGAKIAR
ncbi:hypothetical protein [Microvirga thermotolerans]|uniref:Uncharacterized protein n=1 Tax=Microvirga thermotolerans TaxID=2651334 RepID=A0A5P9JS14_9HYPH|nr:hypothetical protein [Microvirga thermotolerans]QFU15153.1 hypothetical protein GDR74_02390 [Microvirga thermotolerans]